MRHLDDIVEEVLIANIKKCEKDKRKQKVIDRIAWKAEAAQRRAKGGHWK